MTTIQLDQSNVVLGSRDGHFDLTNNGVPYGVPNTHQVVGHNAWPKRFPCIWQRWKLPIPKNAIITSARFTFRWLAIGRFGQAIGGNDGVLRDPSRIDIVVVGPDDVALLGTGEDVPHPTSQAESIAYLDAGNAANQFVMWWGGQLKYDNGYEGTPLVTTDIKDLIQKLVDQTLWEADLHAVFLFADPLYREIGPTFLSHSLSHNRSWAFYGYDFSGVGLGYQPILEITYEIETPKPTADKHVEHTLDFTQSLSVNAPVPLTVENTLSFTQEITVQQFLTRSYTDNLFFYDSWTYTRNKNFGDLTDFILFQQEIGVSFFTSKTVEQELLFDQTLAVNTTTDKTVQDTLDFEQEVTVVRQHRKSVEHTLTFLDDLTRSTLQIDVYHDLDFEQEVHGTVVEQQDERIEQILSFEQEFTVNLMSNRTVEHVLTFNQAFLAQLDTGDDTSATCSRLDLKYEPQTNDPDFASLSSLGDGLGVTLEYPFVSATEIVELPSPLMSNQEEFITRLIQRKTRGGQLINYSDSSWPTETIFRMSFGGLSDDQKSDLFNLMGVALGQPVKLTDHEGRSWKVIIINPNGESAQVYRECGHTAEFHVKVVP